MANQDATGDGLNSMARGEMILYAAADGTRVQLRAADGTVWLSQAQIAELYGTTVSNVNHVISRVLADGEVDEATIDSGSIVRVEGGRQVRRKVKVYNLDMVLAIGYRSTSPRAIQFRQWPDDDDGRLGRQARCIPLFQ